MPGVRQSDRHAAQWFASSTVLDAQVNSGRRVADGYAASGYSPLNLTLTANQPGCRRELSARLRFRTVPATMTLTIPVTWSSPITAVLASGNLPVSELHLGHSNDQWHGLRSRTQPAARGRYPDLGPRLPPPSLSGVERRNDSVHRHRRGDRYRYRNRQQGGVACGWADGLEPTGLTPAASRSPAPTYRSRAAGWDHRAVDAAWQL